MAEVDEHVAPGHERPQPRLVDPVLADERVARQAEALESAVEVEAGRGRPDEEQRDVGMRATDVGRRLQELGDPLARVHDAEAGDDRSPATRSGSTAGAGHAGCGMTSTCPS